MNKKGFTLVEMIVYVTIFAVILSVIVKLFWQVQLSEAKARVSREVKENTSQTVEIFKRYIRKADDINTGSSVFSSHPSTLSLQDDGAVTIDTYTKNVTVGGQSQTIRKLRLAEPGYSAIDITSDYIDVTNFVLTDLTQGINPDTILMDLTLSSINPGDDSLYDHEFSIRTNITVRTES